MIKHILLLFIFPIVCMAESTKSKFPVKCIHDEVAKHLKITLTPEIPMPEVIYESDTTVERFLELGKANFPGDFKPTNVMNIYAHEPNIIFLSNVTSTYYGGRHIEDSLAHELVHFFQVKYRGQKFENDQDDYLEIQAIYVQQWFRETFLMGNGSPCR